MLLYSVGITMPHKSGPIETEYHVLAESFADVEDKILNKHPGSIIHAIKKEVYPLCREYPHFSKKSVASK